MVVSGCLQMHYLSKTGFILDDWNMILASFHGGIGPIGDYLNPHAEHMLVLGMVIYKIFLNVFGIGSPLPIQLFSVFMNLICGLMLFF